MTDGTRRLVLRFAVAVALLAAADYAVRLYARENFITGRRLATAIQAGERCLVFSGGSDMQAAIDVSVVARSFRDAPAPCLANLTLGGTSPDVRFMAFREYLAAARRPSELVIGFRGHDVIDERDLAPGHHIGNDAAIYEWGTLADFKKYYPRLSFAALDNGLRFLLYRATALGANRQALWIQLDLLEQRLGMKPKLATNELGNVQAFLELEAEMRTAALSSRLPRDEAAYRLAVWPARLVDAARTAGTRVSFVRLPATENLERVFFTDKVSERAFGDFLTRIAREHGGRYIDLSKEPWMNDSLVVDGLHYSSRGAELISEALGRSLAEGRTPGGRVAPP